MRGENIDRTRSEKRKRRRMNELIKKGLCKDETGERRPEGEEKKKDVFV